MGEFTINIRRKIKPGELIELSQKDLENLEGLEGDLPDPIKIRSLTGQYSGSLVWDSGRVRVMVGEVLVADKDNGLILLQAIPESTERFNRIIEVALELGVDSIIPIQTYYDKVTKEGLKRISQVARNTLRDSIQQSMNDSPTDVHELSDLKNIRWDDLQDMNKICLTTEPIENSKLSEVISPGKAHLVAIGPPRGWHSSEIELFRQKGFSFVNLKTNILRTDTAGVVVASIIKYIQGEL